MQEDIEHKSAVLVMRGAKITGRLLAKAMAAALRQMQKKRDAPGKQSFRQLSKGGPLESIPVSDDNIKAFDPIARKYGLRYKLVRDASENPPKWLMFFRSRDSGAMTAAFKEFTHQTLNREAAGTQTTQTAQMPMILKKRIGSTTFHVIVWFSSTGKETLEDKIHRLIEREAA